MNNSVTSKNFSILVWSKSHRYYCERQPCEKSFKIRSKDNYLQPDATCDSGIKSVVIHVWTWIFDLSKRGLSCSLLLLPGITASEHYPTTWHNSVSLEVSREKEVTRAQKEEEKIIHVRDEIYPVTSHLLLLSLPFSNFWNQQKSQMLHKFSLNKKKKPKAEPPLRDLKLRIITILSILLPMPSLEKSSMKHIYINSKHKDVNAALLAKQEVYKKLDFEVISLSRKKTNWKPLERACVCVLCSRAGY